MAQVNSTPFTGRCAVVTGANKGIGLEICRQLATNGITVVLTARDEKRGGEAAEKLRGEQGLADRIVFHKLEVTDSASVASLVEFIKAKFGKLDILVNNAGVNGAVIEGDPLVFEQMVEDHGYEVGIFDAEELKKRVKADGKIIETYELAEDCVQINYYGAKRMIDAFIPLLELSDLPRIVNMSSAMGLLLFQTNEWAKGVLGDAENLTAERIDGVINEFLKDFKEGNIQKWAQRLAAYKVAKSSMNAYSRIIAKKYPKVCINDVCPGYVKTDMGGHTGRLSVEEGAESPVRLALLPEGSPSGLFYIRQELSSF